MENVMNGNMGGQQRISIRPEDTKEVRCNNCNGMLFIEAFMVRSVSAIISPSGKEEVFQIPVPVCMSCGTPLGMDSTNENGDE